MHALLRGVKLVWLSAIMAVGLVGGGLLGPSFSSAADGEQPKKEEPKKDEPKKEPKKRDLPPGFPDLEEMLKNLPGGVDPQQMEEFRKQMQKAQEEMRKVMDEVRQLQNRGGLVGPGFPFGRAQEGRLGAVLSKPGEPLVEQLDLPKGKGLVVDRVEADSAAAKAGIKSNDILLELNGKPVPNDVAEFRKLMDDIKPDTAVDAVVLRKGKKETIKGLKLPEAKPDQLPGRRVPRLNLPQLQPGNFPGNIQMPNFQGVFGNPPGTTTTTITNHDGKLTATHHDGALTITVTGSTEDGKTKVGEIRIQHGGENNSYQSVDRVPEQYKAKVKELVEQGSKGDGFRLEYKFPQVNR